MIHLYFIIFIDSCGFQGHPGALRRRNIDLEIWDDYFFESVKILVIPKPTSESISHETNTVLLRSHGKSSKSVDFIDFDEIHWKSSKPLKWQEVLGVCRDLPSQCHRFKRRKRVFWHHKNILDWGNFDKFRLEWLNLFFCFGNSRKSRILVKIDWFWPKSLILTKTLDFRDEKTQILLF